MLGPMHGMLGPHLQEPSEISNVNALANCPRRNASCRVQTGAVQCGSMQSRSGGNHRKPTVPRFQERTEQPSFVLSGETNFVILCVKLLLTCSSSECRPDPTPHVWSPCCRPVPMLELSPSQWCCSGTPLEVRISSVLEHLEPPPAGPQETENMNEYE